MHTEREGEREKIVTVYCKRGKEKGGREGQRERERERGQYVAREGGRERKCV